MRQNTLGYLDRCVAPLLAILITFTVASCATTTEQVSAALSQRHYDEAKRLLEEKGVEFQKARPTHKKEDVVSAIEAYTKGIEADFDHDAAAALSDGKPRKAMRIIEQGMTLCPWSISLFDLANSTAVIVQQVDTLSASVSSQLNASGGQPTAPVARRALVEATGSRVIGFIQDTPTLLASLENARTELGGYWSQQVRERPLVSDKDQEMLTSDLILMGGSTTDGQRVAALVQAVKSVANQIRPSIAENTTYTQALLNPPKQPATRPFQVRKVFEVLQTNLDTALREGLIKDLVKSDPSDATVNLAEDLVHSRNNLEDQLFEPLALGHVARALQRSNVGWGAAVALVHLERAQSLAGTKLEGRIRNASSRAKSAIAATGKLSIPVEFRFDQQIDPIVKSVSEVFLRQQLIQRTRVHIKWEFAQHRKPVNPVVISVEKAEGYYPNLESLPFIQSEYLSHYQDVPNPQKKYLKALIESQEYSVQSAKNAYEFAVSMYNINPTEYGLNNANWAYSTYRSSIDYYNTLVVQYNVTPSTIAQPVYLPYSFKQGTIYIGWEFRGGIAQANTRVSYTVRTVDADSVRLGTKSTDKNPTYRRDDGVDIDVSTDHLLDQLQVSVRQIVDHMAEVIHVSEYERRASLTDVEQKILDLVAQPFVLDPAMLQRAGLPSWAAETIPKVVLDLPQFENAPVVTIKHSIRKGLPRNSEEAFAVYAPAVALISSKGEIPSFGSGVLISGDGLVLTAAHVITGSEVYVSFPASKDNKAYKVKVLFTNDKKDVALITADGYKSQAWVDVELKDGPPAGEEIIAIGNPALEGRGIAVNAITKGIVSRPYSRSDDSGLERIVGDLTISSGSSGGPVISMKTGRVIGLVTDVVSPHISESFGQSGYRALIAPSVELSQWLGLRYQDAKN